MRVITVLRDGISTKVVAAALTSLAASAVLALGVHLQAPVEIAITALLTALAGYLVPEKTAV